MSRAGDIHNLPPEDRPDADRKLGRPWLLLHTPGEDTPHWAFAYGTTQGTEAVLHAAPLSLHWIRTSGRPERSDFYPARLRTPCPEDAGTLAGRARTRPASIHDAFGKALGLDERVGWSGDPAEAGRGRIVRLSQSAHVQTDGARYALIVTSHEYAVTRRYQHLVPIYDAETVLPEPGEVVVRAAWTRRLPRPMDEAILAVPSLFTGSEEHQPFVPGHIAAFTSVAVDGGTVQRVNQALIQNFGL